ncbi:MULTISPECIES: hypothetical protein [Pseudomonas]|uniref:hypothetical protein n=1 Tax=Pseudomonas TaxID=286 RepID=UPI0022272777|nr:hypothetical protein [Pseudomonas sp. JUb96]MCW2269782.1 putative Zn-binding protein involved in type VI secretion [Pseudomonas sp. JUb96]
MTVHRMNINGRGARQHGDQTTSGATCLSSQSHSTQSGVPHLRLGMPPRRARYAACPGKSLKAKRAGRSMADPWRWMTC